MFRTSHRFSLVVAALAVAALAIPATSTAVDYRNPDSRTAIAQPRSSVDLRSPDAKDVGRVAQSPSVQTETAKAPGFDWGDAGIGAGTVLGLALIGLSVTFAVVHRRRDKVQGSAGPALTS